MKKTLSFIVILLFLLLIWFSWGWYKTTIACCEQSETLLYDCSTNNVTTNSEWPAIKKGILEKRKPEKKLLIVSPLFDGEDKSVGMLRANNVGKLFDNIEIVKSTHPSTNCEETKSKYLHETKFKWVTVNDHVIEDFDSVTINYKYDSTEELQKEKYVSYFKELATFLINTGDLIEITGHTDSDGSEEYNMTLGMDRAKEVKQHLLDNNVPESQIKLFSKGKSNPVNTNATEEGKQQNRRVVIHLFKN